MGAKKLFLTNAAGGVNPNFKPGDFMMITDHITTGIPSPLIGPNIEELGCRFPDMSEVYSRRLREVIRASAEKCGIGLQEGVYVQFTGPAYETPAEVRMAAIWGGDAVGMSTACEAMAARHMGIEVCGISCIQLLFGHADAVIGDSQQAIVLIAGEQDAEIALVHAHGGIGQALIIKFVDGIRSVGDQLTQEDLLVGVDGVDHHVHQLFGFCLKLFLFHMFLPHSRRNAHFIYNTLDMFAGKLTLDGEFDTADYICDFAQMIRYNTMTSTELPLEKELEHVINYVNLEKCRYGDSVELRIHVPEELRQIIIPRFLLQPIVENSFEHGFTGMAPEEKRQIIITARKMGDRMILRVRDNGRGMSLKQVEEMNQKFSQPYDAIALRHQKEHGIGLDNINDRLQIFSHSNDRLVLRSREGKYTSMFILQTL